MKASELLSTKYEFLIVGNSHVGGMYQREQALACELAKHGYRVKFIEEIPSLAANIRRIIRKIFLKYSIDEDNNNQVISENLDILQPPSVPTIYRNSMIPFVDRMIFRKWFKKKFNEQDWSKTIMIITFPYIWNGFINRQMAPAKVIITDYCDINEVSCKSNWALKRTIKGEELLKKDVALVTYSAFSMQNEIKTKYPNVESVCIPNATYNEFIKSITNKNLKKHKKRKNIGYIGSTDIRWFDENLLIEAIRSYPDCDFTLCAPLSKKLYSELKKYNNVAKLGFSRHIDIAKVLSDVDIGLIPFMQNRITNAVNPLKLYEYCAAGIPTVAMWTKELNHYKEYVYLAKDTDEFISLITLALSEESIEKYNKRKRFAEENTWEARVQILIEKLSYIVNKSDTLTNCTL